MRIGELSKRANCPVETLRYWEREGLLHAPARTEGNYREYSQVHLEHVLFIRNCRVLGMSLDEIRHLLALWQAPQENCNGVNSLVDEHIGHVVEKIRTLKLLEKQLRELRRRCTEGRDIAACGIIEGLTEKALPLEASTPAHVHSGSSH